MTLPNRVLEALRETGDGEFVAVVATVDADGKPHTAPFGSVRALSSARLRFGCDRRHDTYRNLLRTPHVVICVVLPPDVAVSVSGYATVMRESMETIETDAVVEIEIDDVKDDMLSGASIESGIRYSVSDEVADFIARYSAEVEAA